MTKEAIWAFFLACGWEPDRWGHLQKTLVRPQGERKYRLKFQAKSVRFEVKGANSWIRLDSAYYGKVSLFPDGALHLGNRKFKSAEQLAQGVSK